MMKQAITILTCVALVACSADEQRSAPVQIASTTQSLATSAANYTFPVGSYIIPMDTTYQDNGIFLAYGLVYQLLKNKVPVSWVIKQGKRMSTIAASGATHSGPNATFTTTANHALAIGDRVTIRDVTVVTYNGTWTVTGVPTTTTFTVTLAGTPASDSGNGTVTPADFITSATDKVTNAAITNYGYRGGPFVVDQADVAVAAPLVTAWQSANPTVAVHVTTAPLTAFVKRQLVAAPTIAQFDDGNAGIATAYLNAAKIPDSQGLAWSAASVDLLTPDEVGGTSCATPATFTVAATPNGATETGTTATITTTTAHNYTIGSVVTLAGIGNGYNGTWTVTGIPSPTKFTVTVLATALPADGGGTATTGDCIGTPHNDGKLFDSNGIPAYCQMMSMHWGVGNADTTIGREVVREYRSFLKFPTHLYGECQAVNAIEDNQNASLTIAASPNGATESGTTATFTTTTAHLLKVGDVVGVSGVTVAGYNGTWTVTATPAINTFRVTLATSGLGGSGGGSAASYNGLFLTTAGYLIDNNGLTLVDSYNYDQPFAQMDGNWENPGGSEVGYSLPAGSTYKAQDVVMLSRRGTPVGSQDVWMTGFLDGQCSTTQEFCDPSFAQGKVSYLGGHDYKSDLPISTFDSQGTRLFLNALLEAPCATDLGVANLGLAKSAPLASNGNQVTYSLTAYNNSASVAGNVIITDVLPAGASFVPPTAPATITTIVRSGAILVTVTTGAAHGFTVGTRVTVAGVTNATFNGTFVITGVPSATQFTYAQTGTNVSSSGGTARNAFDGTCVGTTAQCSGSGGGIVTFDIGAVGSGQTATVNVTVQFSTPAIYSNTATAAYKAGTTTFTATSNTTTTCYYAGNPSICSSGCDVNAPACGNGCDDDADGVIDFPDDTGCDSALDTNETNFSPTGAIKARVLIVFDTSGSMMWNTCRDDFTGGDGSLACPGADVACAPSPPGCGASGCGNATADDSRIFKVKRGISNVVNGFGEVEWGLMKFHQLPTAFSCGTLNVNRNDGGWQGAGGSPCTGFASGDLVVKFDPENINSLLSWMDGASNYPGTPPPGKDFELRATGNTPLAGSLASARTYIAQARGQDPALVASCRPYQVILVTDGGETCAGDPVTQATSLYATGDLDGRVPVHVIGFSTSNAGVQTQLNQIAAAGGTTSYIAADDDAELSSAIEAIVESTILKELCNDLDDDCDGNVDEDFGDKDTMCSNGAKGACARPGTRVCKSDGHGTQCTAVAVACTNGRLIDGNNNDLGPCAEVCNNADDDCDGKIDEALSCNCQANSELCNGADDDCDGDVDEDVSNECTDCCVASCCKFDSGGNCIEDCTAYQDTGECDFGDQQCAGGGYVCTGYKGPQPEVCDGLDNDCDGTPDDNAICPNPGDLCIAGQCVFPCVQSEFPCPFGYACKTLPNCGLSSCLFCTPDPCLGKTCAVGFECHVDDGQCHDLCEGNACPSSNTTCMNGYCLDCFSLGCPAGEKCIATDNGFGTCMADACANVTCGDGEFCNAGTCTPIACSRTCDTDELCINGTCQPDKCFNVQCESGEVCRPTSGTCIEDPCASSQCPTGQICVRADATCIADPCAVVACPADRECSVTYDGVATCNDGTRRIGLTVGGGGCSTGGQGTGAPLLVLAALGLVRRRRRKRSAITSTDASS